MATERIEDMKRKDLREINAQIDILTSQLLPYEKKKTKTKQELVIMERIKRELILWNKTRESLTQLTDDSGLKVDEYMTIKFSLYEKMKRILLRSSNYILAETKKIIDGWKLTREERGQLSRITLKLDLRTVKNSIKQYDKNVKQIPKELESMKTLPASERKHKKIPKLIIETINLLDTIVKILDTFDKKMFIITDNNYEKFEHTLRIIHDNKTKIKNIATKEKKLKNSSLEDLQEVAIKSDIGSTTASSAADSSSSSSSSSSPSPSSGESGNESEDITLASAVPLATEVQVARPVTRPVARPVTRPVSASLEAPDAKVVLGKRRRNPPSSGNPFEPGENKEGNRFWEKRKKRFKTENEATKKIQKFITNQLNRRKQTQKQRKQKQKQRIQISNYKNKTLPPPKPWSPPEGITPSGRWRGENYDAGVESEDEEELHIARPKNKSTRTQINTRGSSKRPSVKVSIKPSSQLVYPPAVLGRKGTTRRILVKSTKPTQDFTKKSGRKNKKRKKKKGGRKTRKRSK